MVWCKSVQLVQFTFECVYNELKTGPNKKIDAVYICIVVELL